MSEDRPRVLGICGATATGKTEIALEVACAVGGEIVNADSRQIYRGLSIGTGAPTPEQSARVPHHLFQFVDPCERYSAGAFVHDALSTIRGIAARGKLPIVVGGTGLYIEALAGTMPMDRAVADDSVRQRVRAEARFHDQRFLHGWLRVLSPLEGARVVSGDRYRTLRALEAVLAGDKRDSTAGKRPRAGVDMRIAIVDIDPSRLDERIAARARAMFAAGILDETEDLRRRCADAPALTGFGYAESIAWRLGEATWNEALRSTIVRTRRYAKRQRTWFRRMRGCERIDASDAHAAASAIVQVAREMSART